MKSTPYIPSIVDFAYDIIHMQEEIEQLRHERDHYKKLHEMNCDALNRSDKHTREMTGLMLKAVLDPDSVINKGHAAILREEMESQ